MNHEDYNDKLGFAMGIIATGLIIMVSIAYIILFGLV